MCFLAESLFVDSSSYCSYEFCCMGVCGHYASTDDYMQSGMWMSGIVFCCGFNREACWCQTRLCASGPHVDYCVCCTRDLSYMEQFCDLDANGCYCICNNYVVAKCSPAFFLGFTTCLWPLCFIYGKCCIVCFNIIWLEYLLSSRPRPRKKQIHPELPQMRHVVVIKSPNDVVHVAFPTTVNSLE